MNSFLDPARIVFENINKWNEAIALDVEVSKMMMTNSADKSSLFNTEDSLIKLAAWDIVDDLFYCNVIKFRDENPIYINRFFEYGAFDNYNSCRLVDLVEEKFQITPFPYAVYNNFNVVKKKSGICHCSKIEEKVCQTFLMSFCFCPLYIEYHSISLYRQNSFSFWHFER